MTDYMIDIMSYSKKNPRGKFIRSFDLHGIKDANELRRRLAPMAIAENDPDLMFEATSVYTRYTHLFAHVGSYTPVKKESGAVSIDRKGRVLWWNNGYRPYDPRTGKLRRL